MSELQHDPPTEQSVPLRCPVWNSPVLRLTPHGLLARCKSCRHSAQQAHYFPKEVLLAQWAELERQAALVQEKKGA